MKKLVDLVLNNPGLYGIFSRPGFGKTTLLMQLIDEALKIKKGKAFVFSFEHFKKQWYERLTQMNLKTDNVLVYDDGISFKFIKNLLEEGEKPVLLAVDYLEISDVSTEKYYKLSKEHSVPIVITGGISRKAQYKENCKPELDDIICKELDYFDFVSILHRHNNCGTPLCTIQNPYVSDTTEFIIVKNIFNKLDNIRLPWNEETRKFNVLYEV